MTPKMLHNQKNIDILEKSRKFDLQTLEFLNLCKWPWNKFQINESKGNVEGLEADDDSSFLSKSGAGLSNYSKISNCKQWYIYSIFGKSNTSLNTKTPYSTSYNIAR